MAHILNRRIDKLESVCGSHTVCKCEKQITILEHGESLPVDFICEACGLPVEHFVFTPNISMAE
jgi:hypothetical protein